MRVIRHLLGMGPRTEPRLLGQTTSSEDHLAASVDARGINMVAMIATRETHLDNCRCWPHFVLQCSMSVLLSASERGRC
jgi:hypothetical protein